MMNKNTHNIILGIMALVPILLFSLYLFTAFRDKEQVAINYFHKNGQDFYTLAQYMDVQYPIASKGYNGKNYIRIEVAGENPPDTFTQQYMSNLQISIIDMETTEIDAEISRTIKFLIREINGTWIYGWYYYSRGNIKNDIEAHSFKIKRINDDWGFYKSIGI